MGTQKDFKQESDLINLHFRMIAVIAMSRVAWKGPELEARKPMLYLRKGTDLIMQGIAVCLLQHTYLGERKERINNNHSKGEIESQLISFSKTLLG